MGDGSTGGRHWHTQEIGLWWLRVAVAGREKRRGGGPSAHTVVGELVWIEGIRYGLFFHGVSRDLTGRSPGIGDVCCRSVSLLLTITKVTATQTKTKRTLVPPSRSAE